MRGCIIRVNQAAVAFIVTRWRNPSITRSLVTIDIPEHCLCCHVVQVRCTYTDAKYGKWTTIKFVIEMLE